MTQPLLRFVHISDTHIHPDEDYNVHYAAYTPMKGVRPLLDAIDALPFTPDFVLHTGDVAYDPMPSAYAEVQMAFAHLRVPFYVLAGNHDDPAALASLYREKSVRFNTEINGVQLVGVDSNAPVPPPRGRVTEADLEWLAQICRANDPRPLVLAVHHNPLPIGSPWMDEFMRITNGEALHAALFPARQRLRGVFHGHIHQNLDVMHDGILYSAAASSWCQFHSYTQASHTDVVSAREELPGFSVVSIYPQQTVIRRHFYQPER